MIITSFMRVVNPLKYPSNACLSCLENGSRCWNAITVHLEWQNVMGVLLVSMYCTKIKHSNIKHAIV